MVCCEATVVILLNSLQMPRRKMCLNGTLVTMVFGYSLVAWVAHFFIVAFALLLMLMVTCLSIFVCPVVYIKVAEVLAVNIRANPCICGLSLPWSTSSLPYNSQYADDTSLIESSDYSFKGVFDTYSLYERGSGSKLNLSK